MYDPESEIVDAAMDVAESFRPLTTVYPKACSDVGRKRCGLPQIRQNDEPAFYLFLCPNLTSSKREPKGEILLCLEEDVEEFSDGFNLSDGLEYATPLCSLDDLK